VRLRDLFDEDFITCELYGVAEHHVRQIHNGLKSWFDGDPAKLFVTPPTERALRLIRGFGGQGVVRRMPDARVAGDVMGI
jgi:alkyl sulfatase BDS1-like metallo-beta-lactamase superfamily hydrolase